MKNFMLLSLFVLTSMSVLAVEAQAESSATASAEKAQAIQVTRKESQKIVQGDSDHFTGNVRVDTFFRGEEPARVAGARVTFEPGARTAWHSHVLGQTLIVTEGVGLVQSLGDPVQTIRQGDVVWIPPHQKHWHGASHDTALTHIAIAEHLDGNSAEWFEKASDEQYGSVTPAPKMAADAGKEKSRSQMLFGDIAPKFAQLTDEVLYADVWERPELSKRDRSLITVAALVAMNRPAQLKSHLSLALKNGVTKEELVEAITHLAFYSGWPNSVTGVTTAKEVFENIDNPAP